MELNQKQESTIISEQSKSFRKKIIDKNNLFYIPKRFQGKDMSNLNLNNKEKYTDSILFGNSLFISGKVGTGKTHLAIALGIEYFFSKFEKDNFGHLRNESKIIFRPATELFLDLKNSYAEGESELEVLGKLTSADLLILDDIGTEKISDWSRQIIFTIIDRFYRNMKQIIITSNFNLNQFADAYDDRIASRLIEMGKVINLTGDDNRSKLIK